MSRKAKRMYTAGVVGVLALGMLVGGVVIWQMHVGAATAGEGPPTPSGAAPSEEEALGPDAYPDIVRLRRAVRLSDGVVAAIGCGGEAAEAAIGKLKGWYASNADTWSLRRADVRTGRAAAAAAVVSPWRSAEGGEPWEAGDPKATSPARGGRSASTGPKTPDRRANTRCG